MEGSTIPGGDLKDFAESVDWTTEEIERTVNGGIQEYHKKTRELIEKAGGYGALEKMEQRQYSPFEQILVDMHKNIASAKKK